ncbi:MAG TPA: leucine/isoleucine/valine transporter permease subunit [Actinomycetota bacterium]|jgi:branched-chain amino acid transport system permease protein
MNPRRLIFAGLIGGIAVIYLGLVGLLAKFAERNLIGELVTGSRAMVAAAAFCAGYVATRPRVVAGELQRVDGARAGAAGALVGATSGALVGLSVVFVDWFGLDRIRDIFVGVSPDLLDFLSFGLSIWAAVGVLTVAGAIFGGLGGAFRSLDPAIRRPLGNAVVITLLMALLQRIVPVAMQEVGLDPDWLYSPVTGGLTWIGAAVVFLVSLGLSVAWMRRGDRVRASVRTITQEQPSAKVAAAAIVIGLLALIPVLLGTVVSDVLGTAMIFLLLAIGLNIVVGYAGLLDLGYVAFFGFGAYTTALLTGATLNTTTGAAAPAISLDLNFYVAIPIVVMLAAGAGVLIGAPVLRLRGDYLAIVTLGLGEMVSILITSNWLAPLVGGPQGMRDVTDAAIGGFGFREPHHFFYLALAFVAIAIFVSWRLASSRIGRAWNAMREDEQVADAMGISTTRFKLLAFAMGGAIGSLGGALLGVKLGSLTPASFEYIVSITVLSIVILGGMGSIPGVVVGALVLIGLPGLLREFEEYRQLIYGAVLVAIMILRPQGLIPNVRRSRELHEEDRAQDKWASDLSGDEDVAAPLTPLGEGAG